jgi:hypothetical protein
VTYVKGIKRKVALCAIELVATIPAPDTDTLIVSDAVTFTAAVVGPPAVPAGEWTVFEISKGGKYSAGTDSDDEDAPKDCLVDFFIPGITAAKSKILGDLDGHEVLAAVPDNMSNTRLLGELERGAIFSVKEQTDDKPGYVCKLTWASAHMPYFYTEALPA